ncbi:MAG: putative rane protein [Herbinix sp.]|nr:putative rane protein [Herbinix sp.]
MSSNLAAISVASVLRFPYEIVLLENHLCKHNLGNSLKSGSLTDTLREVGSYYYEGGGMEGLLRRIYRGDHNNEISRNYRRALINNHLDYIPQGKIIHHELFDYEFSNNCNSLFQFLERSTDILMVDCHHNLSSKTILEEADLIVVNLTQNSDILEDFFLNYPSLISKSIFIISKYHPHSNYHSKRISQQYNIPIELITLIPYNEMFSEAIHNGNLIEFIFSHYHCDKSDENYYFIQGIKKAAYMIIKRAESLNMLHQKILV